MKIIKDAEDLLRKILIHERGRMCQLCLSSTRHLGMFHILPKKHFSRLRLERKNILLAGWFCCHQEWHDDYYRARDKYEPRIKALCGEDYEIELKVLNQTLPALNIDRARQYKMKFQQELDEL